MSSPYEFTYLSTFAGCGGSSLGYKWAGGRGVLAIEFDDNAVETYHLNFPDTPIIKRDIAKVSVKEVLDVTKLSIGQLDIFDGSPPCQGFSTAGSRKFDDPRNSLFKEYVRLVEGLQPKVFVMENVSGMVKGKMKLAFKVIMETLKATGYNVKCQLLNAMYYEVPQSRERLIWIGVRPDIGITPTFPKAVGKPVTVREAIGHLPNGEAEKHAAQVIAQWTTRNKHVGSFHSCRLHWDKPSPTMVKAHLHWHPDVPRHLCPVEAGILASFPNDYKWVGNIGNIKERIGNCVPPRFMYHIATHIKENILLVGSD